MSALFKTFLFWALGLLLPMGLYAQHSATQMHYQRTVRPIIKKHCTSCHNGEDKKGGIDLYKYDFVVRIIRDGALWTKVVDVVRDGSMPPDIRPPMSQQEIDTLSFYLDKYIQDALAEKDPGLIYPRKLNNREYRYTIEDLLGITVNTDSLFPSEASGGAGFDNQARVLYLTPLHMERYYEAAELIVDQFYQESALWRNRIPPFRVSWAERMRVWWNQWWHEVDLSQEAPREAAENILIPLATQAYRRFLNPKEKQQLLSFFDQVFQQMPPSEERFDLSIKEAIKPILVSHNFLYRMEQDADLEVPYKISGLELASRLSYFIWSSMPDDELLNLGYKGELLQEEVLNQQVQRMLRDPKAERLGESFALHWLEISKLKDPQFQMDPETYPAFTPVLRDLMLKEVELFFNHVMRESKNLMDLIDSDYSFLNKRLAEHYGLQGIEHEDMAFTCLETDQRGGVLGMAGVLTASSTAVRTSPVLRGKWVLEQILGTPAPPPPPNVSDLEIPEHAQQHELNLRELMIAHRDNPACKSCHLQMDPLGLGLENFDAIGRWRDSYSKDSPIDASGVLKTGESFEGPAELRKILTRKRSLYAKNLSKKMLSFALGRSLQFKDTPTIQALSEKLLETDFNSFVLVQEIAKSYPFLYKKSDRPEAVKIPS